MPPIPKKTTAPGKKPAPKSDPSDPKPKAAPASRPGASGGRRAAAKSAGAAAAGSGAAAPAVAAATYLKERHGQKQAVRAENRQARDTGRRSARLSAQTKKGAAGSSFLTRDLPRQALLGEFMLCVIVVIAGTVTSPAGSNNGATRMMIKLSGLSALFFILALVSAGGPGPAKAAGGLGALVTLSYVVSSQDAGALAKWVGSYFSPSGGSKAAGPDVTQGAYDTGTAPAAAAPSGGGLTVEQGAT